MISLRGSQLWQKWAHMMTPWWCHCVHCKAPLSNWEASMSIIRCSVCVHVWDRNRAALKNDIACSGPTFFHVHSWVWVHSECDALAAIQACASEFRVATLRLIWAKPVFVTYRITHLCENAIYVKHAGNGEKGTRERGHPRKLNPEECGSLAINEEHSSPVARQEQRCQWRGEESSTATSTGCDVY